MKLNMLQLPFYYILEYKISVGMRAMRKKLNIFMLQLPIYYIIRIGNLDLRKCGHRKSEGEK